MGRLSQLSEAQASRKFVRFKPSYEEQWVSGYVLDVGRQWFLMAIVNDFLWLDGFQAFHLSSVRSLQCPAPNADFHEAALKYRHERVRRNPRISIDTTTSLLLSANKHFPLVTIHREKVAADECNIGRVLEVNRNRFTLLEIGTDAKWEPTDIREYRLTDVTRVDVGGGYEEALHLVGGHPPQLRKR